jgi:predicted RNA-binding protein with PUA-like domain
MLSEENMTNRTEASRQFLDRTITTDETWFHYYDPETEQQSSQWKNVDSPRSKKAKVTKSLGKNMFNQFNFFRRLVLIHLNCQTSFPVRRI